MVTFKYNEKFNEKYNEKYNEKFNEKLKNLKEKNWKTSQAIQESSVSEKDCISVDEKINQN